MKEELEEIIKWTSVSGSKVNQLYIMYRKIQPNDKQRYCTKCPAVIRNIFNKVKNYYIQTYEK